MYIFFLIYPNKKYLFNNIFNDSDFTDYLLAYDNIACYVFAIE